MKNDLRINQLNKLAKPCLQWLKLFSNVSSEHVKGFYYDAYYNDLTLNEEHFDILFHLL
jgi:hypothetical protein